MGQQRFLEFYHNYALAIGVSSHRLVAGKLQQTCLTRSYALVLNVIVLGISPWMIWASIGFLESENGVPNHISCTSYVFYSACFASIVFTILSRGSRDSDSVKLHRIVYRLRRKLSHETDRVLMYLFYFKFGTMTYLCLSNMAACFFVPKGIPWNLIVVYLCLSNFLNIPIIATYRYFQSLWFISYCYQYINSRIEDISNSVRAREPRKCELREMHRLWSLHTTLRGCIQRMNKDYSLPLMMGRFDFVSFSVINGYWGVLFSLDTTTSFHMILYGSLSYWVHMIDFFLIDTMCDITVRYQNAPHHEVSEGCWYKEVLLYNLSCLKLSSLIYLQMNSFLLYTRTAKIKLWICGLYTTDRRCWYKMMGFILNLCILLLQFHLITVHTLKKL